MCTYSVKMDKKLVNKEQNDHQPITRLTDVPFRFVLRQVVI